MWYCNFRNILDHSFLYFRIPPHLSSTHHTPPVPCHLSPVPCHLSPAHLSAATCYSLTMHHLSPAICHSLTTCHLSLPVCFRQMATFVWRACCCWGWSRRTTFGISIATTCPPPRTVPPCCWPLRWGGGMQMQIYVMLYHVIGNDVMFQIFIVFRFFINKSRDKFCRSVSGFWSGFN